MKKIFTTAFVVVILMVPMVAFPQPRDAGAQNPPIAQTLIREGDFAIRLADGLRMGPTQSEAQAESMLTSSGISPKNGWIGDYPVTPDIIGELQDAVSGAADSGKLAMNKDEAMRAFQDLIAQQGLPVRAGSQGQYATGQQPYAANVPPQDDPEYYGEAGPPQDYPEYYDPSLIDDYYYDQGPPIVTYYRPPWDYFYLYAWVPYPFWFSGFWFPGFFCLHDFHRSFFFDGHRSFISNHFRDAGGRRFGTIDPARRHMGNSMANISRPAGRFASHAASSGASSILRRSFDRAAIQHSGGISGNRGSSSRSNFRGGPGGVRSSAGYRSPSAGYSPGGRISSGHTPYGSLSGRSGSFSHPGMGMGRSFSSPPRAGGFGSHGSVFGSRGLSGGGGRGFSGGGGFRSHSGGFGGRGFSGGGGRGFSGGHGGGGHGGGRGRR